MNQNCVSVHMCIGKHMNICMRAVSATSLRAQSHPTFQLWCRCKAVPRQGNKFSYLEEAYMTAHHHHRRQDLHHWYSCIGARKLSRIGPWIMLFAEGNYFRLPLHVLDNDIPAAVTGDGWKPFFSLLWWLFWKACCSHMWLKNVLGQSSMQNCIGQTQPLRKQWSQHSWKAF